MILPLLLAMLQGRPCLPVQAEHIYGRDLAAADSAFAGMAPDKEVGFAPSPASTRVFYPAELRMIATQNHIELAKTPDSICFQWPLAVPAKDALMASMSKALGARAAHIEITEQSETPVPPGALAFPMSGITGYSGDTLLWRGYVDYAKGRQFPTWARVRIRVQETHVVAIQELKAGQRIAASDVTVQPYEGPLLPQDAVTGIKDAVGMIPHRVVTAGSMLLKNEIGRPRDVEPGDTVNVTVEDGAARVDTQGIAQEGGSIGSTIKVKNSRSGQMFMGRIQAPKAVVVVPGGPIGLVAAKDDKR